jgi:hypothetical protein
VLALMVNNDLWVLVLVCSFAAMAALADDTQLAAVAALDDLLDREILLNNVTLVGQLPEGGADYAHSAETAAGVPALDPFALSLERGFTAADHVLSRGDVPGIVAFWRKLAQAEPVVVVVMGGSVARGNQLEDQGGSATVANSDAWKRRMWSWPGQLEQWLNGRFPTATGSGHRVINLAVGGTGTIYTAQHYFDQVQGQSDEPPLFAGTPGDAVALADLVLCEFSVNDAQHGDSTLAIQQKTEMLLRLVHPRPVAYLEFNYYIIHPDNMEKDNEWRYEGHTKVARHYRASSFDVRSALLGCRAHAKKPSTGAKEVPLCDEKTKLTGRGHPDLPSHRFIAEALILFLSSVADVPASSLKMGTVITREWSDYVPLPMPPPMYAENDRIGGNTTGPNRLVHAVCSGGVEGEVLSRARGSLEMLSSATRGSSLEVLSAVGWSVYADDPKKAKKGCIVTMPGGKLVLQMNFPELLANQTLELELGYLSSYENVGCLKVEVHKLADGEPLGGERSQVLNHTIDAQWTSHSSQYNRWVAKLAFLFPPGHDYKGSVFAHQGTVTLELLPSDGQPSRKANKFKLLDLSVYAA